MKPFPISRWTSVRDVPASGRTVDVTTSEAERDALARFLGIRAVRALSAELTLTPWRGVGVAITGRVDAVVDQDCVVTLEPVTQTVEEDVDLRLLPERLRGSEAGAEISVDPVGEDAPDPLEGDAVDLGAIACEHLALGLDPYPRAPGVAFEGLEQDGPESDGTTPQSPFAALAALKGQEGQ